MARPIRIICVVVVLLCLGFEYAVRHADTLRQREAARILQEDQRRMHEDPAPFTHPAIQFGPPQLPVAGNATLPNTAPSPGAPHPMPQVEK